MDGIAAAAFYGGLAALCAGTMLRARGAVERKPARFAVPLLIAGALGIGAALVAYANGPRNVLPF